MAKQVNVSFKENDTELELYNWVKSKLNPGTYIKELLYNDYLADVNGLEKVKYSSSENKQVEVEEGTTIETDEFNFK